LQHMAGTGQDDSRKKYVVRVAWYRCHVLFVSQSTTSLRMAISLSRMSRANWPLICTSPNSACRKTP
jgi:hypothetical protein